LKRATILLPSASFPQKQPNNKHKDLEINTHKKLWIPQYVSPLLATTKDIGVILLMENRRYNGLSIKI